MEAVKTLLKQITAFWEGKDKRFRRIAIIIASVALVAIVVSSILINQVQYATLYSGLEAEDSSAVLAALKEQKVPFRVAGDSILVPADQADSLRISLSTQVEKGFNLDILKQGQGLGLTDGDKDDYRRYQIQFDIRNSLMAVEGIRDARVAITIPAESVLVIQNSRQDATAGIILTLDSGVELKAEQIKAIYLFVQKNVPGLKLDNISIMDSNMSNLDYTASNDDGVSANDRFALKEDVQTKLRRQIMALLQPVFGIGRVEAQVSVTLDFDDRTVESIKFEPIVDGKNGIIVSIDELRERIVNGQPASGEPGTDENAGTPVYPVVNADPGTYEKNAKKINYEIDTIKETLKKEKGALKSLSVSVVIDNTDLKEDYSDSVKNLVATAVGVSHDLISVEFMPMLGSQAIVDAISKDTQVQATRQQNQQNQFYLMLGAVLLVALVAMMLVFAARRAKQKAEYDQQTAILAAETTASEEMQQLEEELEAIKIVKESGTKEQIGHLIQNNPDLVANLLRSWLADEQE